MQNLLYGEPERLVVVQENRPLPGVGNILVWGAKALAGLRAEHRPFFDDSEHHALLPFWHGEPFSRFGLRFLLLAAGAGLCLLLLSSAVLHIEVVFP